MHFKFATIAVLATLATTNALVPRQEAPQAQSVNPAKSVGLLPPPAQTTMDAATMQQLQQLIESQALAFGRPAPFDQQGLPIAQIDGESQASKWGGWGEL
ncbi:hypothetical protein DFQ27_003703 [Actinomortierella ambigua]|uniref:Uncharacterized protein n=1 Tax=Actinomortierella ambigua TaxID=1343610 RepID=A0A9P6UCJ5_9FUNG|nr:hypothetical protein DFQ27_003703 [Actinomortierella ambigua]